MGLERAAVTVGLALVWGAGCFSPSPQAQARLAQTHQDGQALSAQVEALEDRLLWSRAALSHWQDLAWRHQQVSAVACQNADTHLESMVRLLERQQARQRSARRGAPKEGIHATARSPGPAPQRHD